MAFAEVVAAGFAEGKQDRLVPRKRFARSTCKAATFSMTSQISTCSERSMLLAVHCDSDNSTSDSGDKQERLVPRRQISRISKAAASSMTSPFTYWSEPPRMPSLHGDADKSTSEARDHDGSMSMSFSAMRHRFHECSGDSTDEVAKAEAAAVLPSDVGLPRPTPRKVSHSLPPIRRAAAHMDDMEAWPCATSKPPVLTENGDGDSDAEWERGRQVFVSRAPNSETQRTPSRYCGLKERRIAAMVHRTLDPAVTSSKATSVKDGITEPDINSLTTLFTLDVKSRDATTVKDLMATTAKETACCGCAPRLAALPFRPQSRRIVRDGAAEDAPIASIPQAKGQDTGEPEQPAENEDSHKQVSEPAPRASRPREMPHHLRQARLRQLQRGTMFVAEPQCVLLRHNVCC